MDVDSMMGGGNPVEWERTSTTEQKTQSQPGKLGQGKRNSTAEPEGGGARHEPPPLVWRRPSARWSSLCGVVMMDGMLWCCVAVVLDRRPGGQPSPEQSLLSVALSRSAGTTSKSVRTRSHCPTPQCPVSTDHCPLPTATTATTATTCHAALLPPVHLFLIMRTARLAHGTTLANNQPPLAASRTLSPRHLSILTMLLQHHRSPPVSHHTHAGSRTTSFIP